MELVLISEDPSSEAVFLSLSVFSSLVLIAFLIKEAILSSQDEMFFVTSGDANIRSKTDLAITFS